MPRVSASASRTCRNHNRQPRLRSIPSRRSSDQATSSGDLKGKTARVDHPASSNTGAQKRMSRHIRGSLITGIRASANSAISAALARARNPSTNGPPMRQQSNLRQSVQSLSPAARTSPFISMMTDDSQKPRSLSSWGAIMWRGASPPRRTKAPATLDAPLRCMPKIRTAVRRDRRLALDVLTQNVDEQERSRRLVSRSAGARRESSICNRFARSARIQSRARQPGRRSFPGVGQLAIR